MAFVQHPPASTVSFIFSETRACAYTSCPVQTVRLLSVFWGCCIWHIPTHRVFLVVSRCRGIGPPSGIPSSGLCWLPTLASWEYPSPLLCLISCCGRGGSSGHPYGRFEAIPRSIYCCASRTTLFPTEGKWRELEWRFQVRFPGIDCHCRSARFFLLALILILSLYSHGYRLSRWPLQDTRSLQSFLALSNHPCIAPSICIAHTIAILVHDECATCDPHPTPLVYAIHHTILTVAISCIGHLSRPRVFFRSRSPTPTRTTWVNPRLTQYPPMQECITFVTCAAC